MNKIKLITKILAIVLISAVSFIGVYTQVQNRMENQVKDYSFGMDLTGARIITLTVSDETNEVIKDEDGNVVDEDDKEDGKTYTTETVAVNSEDVLTKENYEKSKEILENRLEKLGVEDYIVKLDEESGKIIVAIPEDDNTDHTVSNMAETGKFEIVDSETKEVLMDNSDIKSSNVLYSSQTSGTSIYLNIEFNKEGTAKLKDISTEYIEIDEDSSDSDEEVEQKEITMQIDDSEMLTTSFYDVIENGSIQLTMGTTTTDTDTLNDTIQNASTVATILDTGNLPIEYSVEQNEYVESAITTDALQKLALGVAIVAILALLFIVVKYRGLGVLASFAYVGLAAVFLLLIRYTNVVLTIEGISAILIILVLNYIFTLKALSKITKYGREETKMALRETFAEFILRIIPICIFSIVFCFINWTPINSFGMTMFWGLAVIIIYNMIVMNNLFKKEESK